MVSNDLIAEHIEVVKKEEITLLRQHIRVTDQEAVPSILGIIAKMFRTGRSTASLEVKFNQGGCKGIVTEQVESKEIS